MFSRKLHFLKSWVKSCSGALLLMSGGKRNILPASVRLSPGLLTSLIVTLFVVGCQKLGGLEALELRMFDVLVCLRPLPEPDPNLLIVAITEKDIQSQKQWPLTDQILAQVFAKLQQHQPSAIGLDLYRDLPQEPGGKELLKQLKADNVIVITKIGNPKNPSVPPPPGISPERIGFNDLVLDSDGVVRRQLLFASGQDDQTVFAFSLQLALTYLKTQGIEPKNNSRYPQYMELGKTIFFPLNSGDGGYANIDHRGYQILLNYRTPEIARIVSIGEVLSNQVQPNWIKNKVILIGTTAPSIPDAFLTPYSIKATENFKMPGVLIHGQMVSQIINSSLIKPSPILFSQFLAPSSSLFRFLPQYLEIVWIGTWAIVGGLLMWQITHPLKQGLALIVGLLSLLGISYGLFLLNTWVPIIAPIFSLFLTGTGVIAYKQIHNSLHDSLTKLPNRTLFLERVGWAILNTKRHQSQCAVLFLNIDRFKRINDSLGYEAGNQLLIEIVQRMKTCLRNQDMIARLGGDEFAILIEHLKPPQKAAFVAERIQNVLLSPFKLNDHDIFMSLSIGIALSEMAESRADYLLRNAHTAMYRARSLGKGMIQVFEQTMHVNGIEQLKLETSLRLALERQEFVLYYQPVISLTSGQIVGFEALIRWQHPEDGLITPDLFLTVAKETGLIVPIGKWAIQEACNQLKRWQAQFYWQPELILGVNLSARQFFQPDLIEQIQEIILTSKINPNGLRLEITESVLMDDVEATIHLLKRLKSLGLKLSIDDFGTGFSSLSYLPRFPIDTLKIDRSFVGQIEADEAGENLAIVRTIIRLAHALNKDVVAEGVETAYQLAQLRSLGCEYAQGYFFLKPVPADIVTAFVESNPQW
ncbi:Diguanylate cyclase/phosphodiesterase [Planktothrix serta PCC 8927]|uniref:Diguanylate cyclase/phosphodiesterase n=1 Tax=Planktothrix serta PCC 8927 TaxID=671068 RepID=A0A7Z9E3Q9_9CYAN|nr:EAL domain-containing protein [Planktothrix serta]VXD25335.1 Diguanylate cyclase/phosphodiesterase [Planktothrix serta PCC 8927]